MKEDLSAGNYAAAFQLYAADCDQMITRARDDNPFSEKDLPHESLSPLILPICLIIGLVAALILFTIFSKGREARVRKKILKSISEEEKKKPEDSVKPVFFETIGGQELPVQLGFYSPGRIVKIAMLLLLVNASTCILAWILTAFKCIGSGDWTLFQQLDYSYNIIWLCLALPISMAGFVVFGRIEVYDSPVIFQLLENGDRKRIHQKKENRKTIRMRWKNVRETMGNWVLPLFIVLPLYVMTVYMIMNPWP